MNPEPNIQILESGVAQSHPIFPKSEINEDWESQSEICDASSSKSINESNLAQFRMKSCIALTKAQLAKPQIDDFSSETLDDNVDFDTEASMPSFVSRLNEAYSINLRLRSCIDLLKAQMASQPIEDSAHPQSFFEKGTEVDMHSPSLSKYLQEAALCGDHMRFCVKLLEHQMAEHPILENPGSDFSVGEEIRLWDSEKKTLMAREVEDEGGDQRVEAHRSAMFDEMMRIWLPLYYTLVRPFHYAEFP